MAGGPSVPRSITIADAQGVSAEPLCGIVYLALGRAMTRQGNHNQAQEQLEWALEQRPPQRSQIGLHGYGDDEDLDERANRLAEALFGINDDDIELDDSHFPVLRMWRDEAAPAAASSS